MKSWASMASGRCRAATRSLLDRAERRMRVRIADLPDGEYMYEHYLDPARLGAEPVKVRVAIQVQGDFLDRRFSPDPPRRCWPRQQRPGGCRHGDVHRAQDLP